jgi:hypothetical protein
MRKVLHGYAKDKNGNLILIGTMRSLLARTKVLQPPAEQKDIWSDKGQRSLRKKRFISFKSRVRQSCDQQFHLSSQSTRRPAALGRRLVDPVNLLAKARGPSGPEKIHADDPKHAALNLHAFPATAILVYATTTRWRAY